MTLKRVTSIAALAWLLAGPALAARETALTVTQLRQDLAAIDRVLHDEHPDIGHSASPAALERQMRRIEARLDHPMDRDAAWRLFATLNPVLADAHVVIGYPDRRGDLKAHVAAGGRLFPFEVAATPGGDLFVTTALGGEGTSFAGARIETINRRPAREVVTALLDRTAGETAGLRASLLSSRFAFLYWKMYGAPAQYEIALRQDRRRQTVRVPGVSTLPTALVDESRFDREFSLEILPCGGAVLRVGTFAWDDKQQFLDFTRNAFGRIRAAGVRTLVIDIRANEGGNDDMWRDGILPYLATARYQWASAFKKRVMSPDPAKGEKQGDVVAGPLETWIEPDPANPLRFGGKTYVLVGGRTYSSSILFTNVMQHFGFATIAGPGDLARADQSGGTRTTALPNSGLAVGWPRFILTRPSGRTAPEFVEPDVRLAEDPFRPRDAVATLTRCPAVADS